jgi:hypothetical protein
MVKVLGGADSVFLRAEVLIGRKLRKKRHILR